MDRHSNYDLKKRYCCLSVVTLFQLRPEKKDTVVWPSFVAPFQLPLLRCSNYDWKKKIQSSVCCYAIPITTRKKNTVVWPSFAAPFQLPLLVAPFQLWPEKKIQWSVHCFAIPITTRKKRYSRLAIIRCAIPIAIVAPFQLRPEKKDTIVCPLFCRSKYDWKKKIWRVRDHCYDRKKKF